jgi:uncharacterized cupredoxin-like copper-binding protein
MAFADTREQAMMKQQVWLRARGLAMGAVAAGVAAAGLAGCAAAPPPGPNVDAGPAAAGTTQITVALSDFAFTPDHIVLHAGTPVRLRLVNESGGGHDFSAPALFAKSSFTDGAAPANGRIEVAAHQTADVTLTPRVPGTYPLECTHFLHAMFGMTGEIQVVP